jgi:hypothetical protein
MDWSKPLKHKAIMSISGHKTEAVFRRYDAVDRGDREQAMKRVTEFLSASKQVAREMEAA